MSAPAKLNLYLNILCRRDDEFHELETLMVPVRFSDTIQLELLTADRIGQPGPISLVVHRSHHLQVAGCVSEPIPTGRDNLVVRALHLLQQRSGCGLGARVNLIKRIPAGSGLGGGSSDAAAALQLANQAWGIQWNCKQLVEVAAEIGSDVPFFLLNKPAVCRGRGERLEPLSNFLPLHFVVVRPPVALATAKVYQAYDALSGESNLGDRRGLDSLVADLRGGNWQGIRQGMLNSLQPVATRMESWIDKLYQAFGKLDLVAHQLTGSGSAYFGICRSKRQAVCLAAKLRSQGLGLVLATCSSL